MKNIFLILAAFLLLIPQFSNANDAKLKEALTNGKWINRADGYIANATYDAESSKDKNPTTVKRFKTA